MVAMVALTLSVFGQAWTEQSFIAQDITWLTVSNNVFGITNLYSFVSRGTNAQGLTYTNGSGRRVLIGPGTNDYKNLLAESVNLWSDKDGNWWKPVTLSNYVNEVWSPTPMTVVIRAVGKNTTSSSGQSLVFNFVPVYDGTKTNESNQAADLWAVAVNQNGTTPIVISTNAPTWRWPGARGMRLRDIYDTDVSSDGMWVQKCSLVGYKP